VAHTVLGVVLAVVVVAGFLVHLPYVIISPGVATPLDDSVLTIAGAPTYPHAGDVRYLTVRVSGSDPNVWKLLLSKLDSDKDVVEREKVVGCLSDAENVAINARLMQQSQDDATKVALERLDYVVTASPPESTILEVCAGAPAYGTLRAADQIIAIDDHPVGAATDIAPLVQAREPGDPLRVTIVRDGTTQTVEVTAGRVVPAVAAGRAGASGAGGSMGVQSFLKVS
jgi:PDZ domain-containing protein